MLVIIITCQNIGAESLPIRVDLLQIGLVIPNRVRFITNRCIHQYENSLKQHYEDVLTNFVFIFLRIPILKLLSR